MKKRNFLTSSEESEQDLIDKLAAIRSTRPRNPLNTQSGLMRFLNEARQLDWDVTPDNKIRHNNRKKNPFNIFPVVKKEGSSMVNFITSSIIIVSLILSGGGITVAAAQNSQPDSILYSLKLVSEDIQAKLVAEPETQAQTVLNFSTRRIQEAKNLIENNKMIPTSLLTRYQTEVNQSFTYALAQTNENAVLSLNEINNQLNIQMQLLNQIQANSSTKNEELLQQLRETVQDRLSLAQMGIANPELLRDQLRQRDQERERLRTCTPTTGFSGTPTVTIPGGQPPWITGSPTPGNGNGPRPGPAPSSTCTPKYLNPTQQPTHQTQAPTQSGPKSTNTPNKPTQSGPNATQQPNKPTESGPNATPQPNQPTQAQPNPTKGSGGPNR